MADLRDEIRHLADRFGFQLSDDGLPAPRVHFHDPGAVVLAPAEIIDTPERAEALGLTADARRMRAEMERRDAV